MSKKNSVKKSSENVEAVEATDDKNVARNFTASDIAKRINLSDKATRQFIRSLNRADIAKFKNISHATRYQFSADDVEAIVYFYEARNAKRNAK